MQHHVVAYLKAHWGSILVLLGGICLGVVVTYFAPKPRPVPVSVACDAGVAVAVHVDDSIHVAPSSCTCDAGTVVKWKDRPPVLVYLPGDAGPCLETVEEDVTIDTSATSTASSGAVDVHVAVDAGAVASAASSAAVTLPGASQALTLSLQAGLSYSFDGNVGVPLGCTWHPGGGDLGVAFSFDPVPASFKESRGAVLLDWRVK